MATRRSFGKIDVRPNGKYRARYVQGGQTYTAETTFSTRRLAERWLAGVQTDIERGAWIDPTRAAAERARTEIAGQTVETYALRWLAERELHPTSQKNYGSLLRNHIVPAFGPMPVAEVRPQHVRTWMAREGVGQVARARAYVLLASIMKTAVQDELIDRSPCVVRKGSTAPRPRVGYAASPAELDKLRQEMPPRYQAMVDLGAWASLRFGEVAALRRRDVDLDAATVSVSRATYWTKDTGLVIGKPKSDAGTRVVALPRRAVTALREHLDTYVGAEQDSLLFPARGGGILPHSTMQSWFKRARKSAGLPDSFAFHQLRHSGQTLAAAAGASLPELMQRAGQSSPRAALVYLHSVDTRAREIAARMDAL